MDAKRTGGKDAVCFTAGPKGAVFSAGVIHAWLAADRKPPEVAAGISAGALTATAMQYSYRALEGSNEGDLEVRRWTWFRKYLANISNSPLDVIWKAIPQPVEFFADRPPVRDLSCPAELIEEEARSRRHYFILIKLGSWLAGLPVTVRTFASSVISYVRWKERYGLWLLMAVWCGISTTKICIQVLYKLCFPAFFSERTFRIRESSERAFGKLLCWMRYHIWSWRFRPLFGWRVWLGAITLSGLLLYTLLFLLLGAAALPNLEVLARVRRLPVFSAPGGQALVFEVLMFALMAVVVMFSKPARTRAFTWLISFFLGGLGLSRGFLHDYHLHRRLLELFGEGGSSPKIEDDPIRLVLVATPLQVVFWGGKPVKSQQVWAEKGAPLVDAIRASLTVPGLFEPLRFSTPAGISNWVDPDGLRHLDLVDGAGVSQNPIPAFFGWLTDPVEGRAAIAETLKSTDPHDRRVHVVYAVPIEPYPPDPNRNQPERMNVVRAAFVSRELERRRDTRQEARQTNFMSELEVYLRRADTKTNTLPIFVEKIAPERDIVFENNLEPKVDEIRATAAAGCRKTLETLYRSELEGMRRREIPCATLLREIAPRRCGALSEESPGVPEICANCTRVLQYRPEPHGPAPGIRQSFGRTDDGLLKNFSHLNAEKPRIVFLASGGVFRGSFHIGAIAALNTLQIRPDLIVGASVGALMGGAFGAVSILERSNASRLFQDLVGAFLRVDEKVALTRTLKNTTKQLGIRGLRIRLSPASLRKMIRRGGQADPGFAAVGAPPALIDAISNLFLIPHGRTRAIASEFVAGHITSAVNRFWRQVERETLPSLDIEHFLMGTSLLEALARDLLGEKYRLRLGTCQPYHAVPEQAAEKARPISFFCTTSDLYCRRSLLLGRDFLHSGDFIGAPGSYDFVNAALSSAAFPVVFAPRTEAQVLPGSGATDVLLADGGMFDNLPFFPAIEILGAIQQKHREQNRKGKDDRASLESALEFLEQRQSSPDMIIAAALDADPIPSRRGHFRTLRSILNRVTTLQKNVKSKTFAQLSERVSEQTKALLKHRSGLLETAKTDARMTSFVDTLVPAGVLEIVPTDTQHINPTFAFCRSVGMQKERVQRSIADGCFQTLRSIAKGQESGAGPEILATAMSGLMKDGRIPRVFFSTAGCEVSAGQCPYFTSAPTSDTKRIPLACPFAAYDSDADIVQIHTICTRDLNHKQQTA